MSIRSQDKITASLARIQKNIETVPEAAYAYWRSITPVRSGNARRKTTLRNNTIDAAYAYAQALDSGASRQAPKGMSEPTIQYLDREYRKRIRK
jgi:hypothetical protein